MFEVKDQITAILKMMNVNIEYNQFITIDNLHITPTGSTQSKTGIYSPEEGVEFLLKFNTQKQEILND